jgi:type 1 fimbria pilin
MKKMNKNIVLAALIAELLAPGISAAAENFTQDVQISGKIVTDTRCSVSISPTLELGEVIDSQITTKDQAPQVLDGATTINLLNCPTGEASFSLSLMGVADSKDPSLLANSVQTGGATNVGVGVWTWPEFKQIAVGGEAVTFSKSAEGGAGINIIVALAKLEASKEIDAGSFESSAQFKIDYL